MGHFTINLPGDLQGDVRCGTVRKLSFSLNLFKAIKSGSEVKKGYIVTVEPSLQKEYRLLKTKAGTWTSEDDGGFKVTAEDKISIEIKRAIDNYERQFKEK